MRAPLACAVSLGVIVAMAAGCSESTGSKNAGAGDGKTSSATEAVQGGTDDGSAHPYAVGVCIGNKGACQGICSGALILPNVVVTARHCVQQTPNETINCATDSFGADLPVNWITTSDWMFQSTPSASWHSVKSVVVPTPSTVCGNDIALIILDDVLASTEATPVIPGVQYSMGDARYEHSYTAIGYGKISEADPGSTCFQTRAPDSPETCPGFRRIKEQIPLVCIPDDPIEPCGALTDTNGNVVLTSNEFIAGEGACQGDSGSSAYETRTFDHGVPVTFGVLSRGGPDPADATKCGDTIYTRLDKYRDLVVQTATTASGNWSLYPKPVPDWTIYVPPAVTDAGADATADAQPSNLGDGASCDVGTQCASGVCADTGSGKVCTTSCDDSASPTTCQAGYVCSSSVCVIATTPPAASDATVTTTKGCSVALIGGSGGSRSPWGALGLAAIVGLVLNVRRASGRARSAAQLEKAEKKA